MSGNWLTAFSAPDWFALAWFLKEADPALLPKNKATINQSRRNYTPQETLKSPVFWVMYLMFVMVAAGGLMATAQLGPIAKDFHLDGAPVSIMGLTLPALTFALTIDRVLNGVTRPFFGWVSDHIGRENTMFVAFALEAVGIMALVWFIAGLKTGWSVDRNHSDGVGNAAASQITR